MTVNNNPVLDFPFKSDCTYYEIPLHAGNYFFEAWGASGGDAFDGKCYGGHGALTVGHIKFTKQTTLYAIIGGKGENYTYSPNKTAASCGGGGKGGGGFTASSHQYANGAAGGGATTVMFQSISLENRIIVSAGGSGACWASNGAAAGGLSGNDSPNKRFPSFGANQTFGYKPSLGEDGRDAIHNGNLNAEGGSGAGSGYFGGTTIKDIVDFSDAAGSAGSSYISGHKGCIQHPNAVFMRTKLISGLELMNLPNGNSKIGNPGDGHLRITYIPPLCTQPITYFKNFNTFYVMVFILMNESE